MHYALLYAFILFVLKHSLYILNFVSLQQHFRYSFNPLESIVHHVCLPMCHPIPLWYEQHSNHESPASLHELQPSYAWSSLWKLVVWEGSWYFHQLWWVLLFSMQCMNEFHYQLTVYLLLLFLSWRLSIWTGPESVQLRNYTRLRLLH